MKTLTLEETAAWLQAHDNYTVLTHRRPDGDAIGSGSALCAGLRSIGKKASLLRNPETTERYAAYAAPYVCEEPEGIILSVDIAGENLFPNNYCGHVDLLIDHHGTNSGFSDFGHVEPDAGACGEIIYRLLRLLGAEISKETAEALYVAVSTDTGCFRYSNTTSETFRVAADLKDCGADTRKLNLELFELKTPARFALEGHLASNMRTWCGGKVAFCTLTEADRLRMGVTEDDADSIAGFSRNLVGVQIGGLLRDIPAGSAKVSVRTDDSLWDAASICSRIGGGGHKAAAGTTLDGASVPELLEKLLDSVSAETGWTITEDR